MSSPPTRYTRNPQLRRPSLSTPTPPPPSSSSTAPASSSATPIPDDAPDADDNDGSPPSPDLPLTMSASVMLTQLPRDATAALATAGEFPADQKVVVRFKPVGGSAPALRKELCKISAAQRFEAVVAYLRRTLKVGNGESVFLYINSTFAPALDEIVGNLHRCFKDSNGQLNVSYSMTPAFG
ncbi:ubiquitin-like protein ATG12 [Pyricularia oryzae 70-15]|uniref:Ubiquitin-like protein ATG12 n=3 Tax=Pyricularia oryzae TaxID=318829 RepID=ATG12_PYRO7|nr:ubiquitin-like protein ATG12 [Pyricularia oryzae 70-15]Q51P78.1 RecName: Full=Ubiquitin-like protein ATG12; AltName: Full=Autophagy-related protein 12 [Pyricularia oryzae 70-15]ELQ38757.1 autophagy related protein 12p [Pyricularia oryzae Y34]KAI7921036.1 ubiquitin-like protein ATG12 [Pyricularia oryzae]EHA48856.1 ubiquitin-like protein ATG12 [Pyricularia oryzae 70-15]KAI7926684.1 ubiquitin-like protein ATG12 [Pyricularia oryzae]